MEYLIQPNWRSQLQKQGNQNFSQKTFPQCFSSNPISISIEPNKQASIHWNSFISTSRTFEEPCSKTTNTAGIKLSNENIKKGKDAEAHEATKPRRGAGSPLQKAIKQDAPKEASEVPSRTRPERTNRPHEFAKEERHQNLVESGVPSHYFLYCSNAQTAQAFCLALKLSSTFPGSPNLS